MGNLTGRGRIRTPPTVTSERHDLTAPTDALISDKPLATSPRIVGVKKAGSAIFVTLIVLCKFDAGAVQGVMW